MPSYQIIGGEKERSEVSSGELAANQSIPIENGKIFRIVDENGALIQPKAIFVSGDDLIVILDSGEIVRLPDFLAPVEEGELRPSLEIPTTVLDSDDFLPNDSLGNAELQGMSFLFVFDEGEGAFREFNITGLPDQTRDLFDSFLREVGPFSAENSIGSLGLDDQVQFLNALGDLLPPETKEENPISLVEAPLPNVGPVIFGFVDLSGDENTAFALAVPGSISINDPDSSNLHGGVVTLALAGTSSEDQLRLSDSGTPGIGIEINLLTGEISHDGVVIGTGPIGAKVAGRPLVIALDGADPAAVTAGAIEALIEAIEVEYTGDKPPAGANLISVTVTDGDGGSGSAEALLTINPVHDAPQIDSNAQANVPENGLAAADINASDPDGETESGGGLIYAITGGTDQALFAVDTDTGVLTFRNAPDFDIPGDSGFDNVYEVQVTVTDGGGLTDTQDLEIRVSNVNEAPSAGDDTASLGEDDGSTNLGNVITGIGAGGADTDPDAATNLVVSAVAGGSPGSSFDVTTSGGRSLSITLLADGTLSADPGANTAFDELAFGENDTATVNYTVSDGSLTDSATATSTINGRNDAPTFSVGPDQTVLEDAGALTVNDFINDANAVESGQTLTFSVTNNSNPALFSVAPAIDADGNLTYAPADDANGTATITVQLSDNGGTVDGGADTSATQTFTINVTSVNDAPSFTVGANQTVAANAGPQVVSDWATGISTGPANEAGENLSFQITGNTNAGIFAAAPTVDADGNLSYTPLAGQSGIATISVSVSDNGGTANGGIDTSATQQFTITLNDAPTISFQSASSATLDEGTALQVTVILTVPGGGTLATAATVDVVDVGSGTATSATDYAAFGTQSVTFAAGSANGATQTVTLTPTQDLDPEFGGETVNLALQNPGGPGTLGSQTTHEVTITDDDNSPPVINSDGGGGTASISVAENQTSVTDVQSSDVDGDVEGAAGLTYQFSGGADQGLFTINANTGVISFLNAPDFENQQDAGTNNIYDVEVTVTDSEGGTDVQALAITVTDLNEAPRITSDGGGDSATLSAAENQTSVTTITASDPEQAAQNLSYTITGGADQNLFDITAGGVLTFRSAPDFENPTDDGSDGVYDVEVTVTDDGTGNLTDVQNIAVTVTNVNEAPVARDDTFSSSLISEEVSNVAANLLQNNGAGLDSDPDGDAFTITHLNGTPYTEGTVFDLPGGGAITVSSVSSGGFTFDADGDFESLAVGETAVTSFSYTITDPGGLSDTANVSINVNGRNDTPDGANNTVTINEDTPRTFIASDFGFSDVDANDTFQAVRIDTQTLGTGATLELNGVAVSDGDVIALADLGGLVFTPGLNETGANDSRFTFSVQDNNDAFDTSPATLQIDITSGNDDPEITSDGGGETATVSVVENQTAVTDVNSSDPDGETEGAGLTYSLSGGTDRALFSIDENTGVLTFITAPDFDIAGDDGGNNVYDVEVTVRDTGGLTDVQSLAVTVTNENEGPIIISNGGGAAAAISVAENQTAVTDVAASDVDGETENGGGLSYAITGGADQGRFVINTSTGVLTFANAPDFENPDDSGNDGTYEVQVTVTDGGGLTDVQDLLITLTNVNEAPSAADDTASLGEDDGNTNLGNVITGIGANAADTDPDAATTLVVSGVTGGTVGSAFTATTSGGRSLSITLLADGTLSANPEANAAFDELDFGETDTATVNYTVSDGSLTDTASATITINGRNDAPNFTVGADQTVLEDAGAQVVNGFINDADAVEAGQTLSFSVTNNSNPALFSVAPAIDADGNLTYTPADDANGTATITIQLADNGGTADGGADTSATQSFTINITPVNDAPSFIVGTNQTVAANAGPQVVSHWASALSTGPADESGQTLSFNVTGNTDASLFSVAPTVDADGNLSYTPIAGQSGTATITVSVRDDGGTANGGVDTSAAQQFTITLNDAPAISFQSATSATLDEGTALQVTVVLSVPGGGTLATAATVEVVDVGSGTATSATDYAAFGTQTVTFAAGSVNGATQTVTLTPTQDLDPEFGGETVNLELQNLGGLGTLGGQTTHEVTITDDDNSPPVINSDGGGETASVSIAENQTSVTDVQSSDVDGDVEGAAGLTYQFSGGADQGLFTINANTGVISFINAPDFENQQDTGTDNVYDVEMTATDSDGGTDVQALAITVTNLNEAPSASNDTASLGEDDGNTNLGNVITGIGASGADTDPDAATTLAVSAVTGGSVGSVFAAITSGGRSLSVTLLADGTLSANPEANAAFDELGFGETDTATVNYTVSDGSLTDTAIATITINGRNDAPTFTVGADQTVLEDAGAQVVNGFINDADAVEAGQTLTFSVTSNSNPALFAVVPTIDADGNLSYTAAANANGTATITVRLSDNGGTAAGGADTSATQTSDITVDSVNDTPEGADNTITINEDTPRTFTVADFGFSDVDTDDTLDAVRIDTLALDGDATLRLSGSDVLTGEVIEIDDLANLVFTPSLNENGADYSSFTFSVRDSAGAFAAAPNTITIDVDAVNDAPQGADNTVTTNEDMARTFSLSDFSFSDVDTVDTFAAVRIDTLTLDGDATLQLSGSNVSAGQVISSADLLAGNLVFTPGSNENGADYSSFTFSVGDSSGAFDATPNTITIDVDAVNDAPEGTDNTITINEDAPRTFTASEFGFTDVDAGDALAAVRIDSLTLDADATLELSGLNVSAGQVIAVGDLVDLIFTPGADENGANYSSFTFSVQDGSDAFDAAPNTLTIDVDAVDDAPAGTDATFTIDEDSPRSFSAADFGFTGVDAGNTLQAVRIDVLTLDADATLQVSGSDVSNGDVVAVADLANLTFTPGANENGADYSSFTFSVQDDDGLFDPTPNTITIDVTLINDAPEGTDNTITIDEDTPRNFSAADFGFTDVDAGDALDAVRIDALTLDADATLQLSGSDVTTGQVIAVADLANLTFTPGANENGADYSSFTFSVRDEDGAFDPNPNTITLDVTAINDTPEGADDTITINEDTPRAFTVADFGFSDVDTVDTLTEVRVDTLALDADATLQLSGSDVAAGDIIAVADLLAGNLVFTPGSNENGADYSSFTFSVRDSAEVFDAIPNILTINVTALNDAPVGGAIANQADDDSDLISLDASGSFSDVENDALTFSASGLPTGLSINSNTGIITGTLDNSASQGGVDGVYAVIVTANDGTVDSNPVSFTWTISNPAPDAENDVASIAEDATATSLGNVISGIGGAADTDPDGDSLVISAVTGGSVGSAFDVTTANSRTLSVSLLANGELSANPNGEFESLPAGATDTATITYTVNDGNGGEDTATVTITVNGANDAPVLSLDPDNSGGGADDGGFASVFATGDAAVAVVDSDAALTDIDSDTLTELTFSVSGVLDGADEVLNIDSVAATLAGGFTGTTALIGGTTFDISVTSAGANAVLVTVSVDGGTGATDDFQSLLRGVTYEIGAGAITSGDRIIAIQANDGETSANLSNVATATVAVSGGIQAIELSDLDGSDGFVINGIDERDYSGHSVSSAGDVNGDGFDDLIIGAYRADPIGINSGESYVVFGKGGGFGASIELSDLDGSDGFVLNGIGTGDYSGFSVSSAGDVNGDGFDDLIIGANGGDPNGGDSGESYVVFGKGGGFGASIDLSTLDGSDGFALNGIGSSDRSGGSVSNAGDVNGDGFDDLIISAYRADPNGSNSGESYVVFGKGGGFGSSIDLSTLDGSNGFVLNGIDADDRSGRSVSSAGDVNGDGFDDLIIGSFNADPNGESSGESYVVFGKGGGFGASIELSDLDGSDGFVINGIDPGDFSGFSVSSAGDVNGDGFDDLIIGAFYADPNGDRSGESYVVFGKSVGFGASIDLSSLDGSNGFVLNGINERDRSGGSVSSAGDVNGDGFDDLIIGAQSNGGGRGESYVVFGKSVGFASSIDLSSLDGSNGFVINGIDSYDSSGRSVSSAGDVNGDGFDDLIIGANGGDPNGSNSGESYVIFGRDFLGETVATGTAGADFLVGDAQANTLTGLGGADVLNGGAGDDILAVTDLDSRLADGGNGTDTLRLDGSGLALDLTAAPSATQQIGNIEVIDLGDDGNILTLDQLSLFNITGSADGDSSTLRVLGGASDTFTADGSWFGGEEVVEGVLTFNRYTQGEATLLVESDVVQNILAAPSVIELSVLDGSDGFVLNGIDERDYSGHSVSSAGDVNGDGFDDLIIGALDADPNSIRGGESYVVFGKSGGFGSLIDLSDLDGSDGFVLNGVDSFDRSGNSVSSAGDVNGDGFDDLIIGASGADPNGSSSGESYVVFGKSGGFGSSINLSSLDGSDGFVLSGIDASDRSGRSVSSAGDVNGDGFDDLIIGADRADPNGSESGESYVVFGKGGGFGASIELSDLDGSDGFVLNGIGTGDYSGFSVSSAGDVNGDGFDDFIIGAYRADPNGSSSGESYVVFGKSGGFGSSINLSSLDGSDGFVLSGIDASDRSGRYVSSAGDVNGDGFDDLIIGADGADPNGFSSGESYVVFGRGGGFGSSIELSTLDGSNGFVLNGIDGGDSSGGSVSSAGDVNGDGFDDLIIGAYRAIPNGSESGESYVVFGKGGGFGSSINLSTLDGSNGFVLNGIDTGDRSGFSVSSAGDVNGDGFDDLIIGADRADPNGGSSGESYVIFGRDFLRETVATGTAEVDFLVGNAQANTLAGLGGADVLNGGAGDDILAVTDLDFRLADGGNGTDTLRLDGSSLDLTLDGTDTAENIEVVDLNGNSNTFTASQLGILNLSDSSNTVRILGNSTNSVTLSGGGWTNAGVVAGFAIFTKGEATVEIQNAITAVSTPISLDLDGDGLDFLTNAETDAAFDFDGDGLAEQSGWIGGGDAFLFLDLDGDGLVSDRGEISFTELAGAESASTDMEALRLTDDTDGDGLLTNADARWDNFKLWQDHNLDGVSQAEEISTLAHHEIVSIGLDAAAGSGYEANADVSIAGVTEFTRADGSTGEAADVAFRYDPVNGDEPNLGDLVASTPLDLDLDTFKSPDSESSGPEAVAAIDVALVDVSDTAPAVLDTPPPPAPVIPDVVSVVDIV